MIVILELMYLYLYKIDFYLIFMDKTVRTEIYVGYVWPEVYKKLSRYVIGENDDVLSMSGGNPMVSIPGKVYIEKIWYSGPEKGNNIEDMKRHYKNLLEIIFESE